MIIDGHTKITFDYMTRYPNIIVKNIKHLQVRWYSSNRKGFISGFIENVRSDLAKNKEIKVRRTDFHLFFYSAYWVQHISIANQEQ